MYIWYKYNLYIFMYIDEDKKIQRENDLKKMETEWYKEDGERWYKEDIERMI